VTRAEAARQRRQKTQERPKVNPFGPPAARNKTAHGAPVLMRGVRANQPVRQRKVHQMKRRMDISLGSSGVELQLPSMPLIRPNTRWISGPLAIALIVLLYTIWHVPQYQAQVAQISGLERLPEREIHAVLALEGRQIFSLDPAQMEHELRAAFPEFSSVEVAISWPNRVMVQVGERRPALAWEHSQGLVFVDEYGFSFPARGDSSGIPQVLAPNMAIATVSDEAGEQVVNPFIGRQLLTRKQVEGLLTLSGTAPDGAVLLFDPARGMGWRDPKGWDVYFGINGDQMPARIAVYKALAKELRKNGYSPALVSIEYLDAPYYRWER